MERTDRGELYWCNADTADNRKDAAHEASRSGDANQYTFVPHARLLRLDGEYVDGRVITEHVITDVYPTIHPCAAHERAHMVPPWFQHSPKMIPKWFHHDP